MKNKINKFTLRMCFVLVSTFYLNHAVLADTWTYSNRVCNSDRQCDDGLWCNGREICDQYDGLSDAHGCAPGAKPAPRTDLPPRIHARCDEMEQRWIYEGTDADGDGHDAIDVGGDDCNDNDAEAFPGNVERCDGRGHDDDCDPTTMGVEDRDGDGWNSSKCYNTDAGGQRHYGGKL